METLIVELGRFIKHRREKKHISTRKLSEMVGKSSTYIWQLENGNVKNPPYDVVLKIFDLLELGESLLINHFAMVPQKIQTEVEKQYDDWLASETDYHRMYTDDMVKRLQRMSGDDIGVMLLMLDKYGDMISQISALHQHEPMAARSIHEYVNFMYKKYIDNVEG